MCTSNKKTIETHTYSSSFDEDMCISVSASEAVPPSKVQGFVVSGVLQTGSWRFISFDPSEQSKSTDKLHRFQQ